MTGKNNKRVQLQRTAAKNPQYGIKKLSVGVVSVAVGTILSLGATTIHAEEISLIETVQMDQSVVEDAAVFEEVQPIDHSIDEVKEELNVVEEVPPIDESAKINENESVEESIPINDSGVSDVAPDEPEEVILDETENVEEEVSTDVDEIITKSSLEVSEKTEAETLNQINKVDILPPKIIDIYPSKAEFTGNDRPTVTIILEEDNLLQSMNLQFVNHEYSSGSSSSPSNTFYFYYNDSEGAIKNELNQYVIELFNYDYSYRGFQPGRYDLAYVRAEDNLGNVIEDRGQVYNSNFVYYQYEGQDFTDPVLIDINLDKGKYNPGDTVELTITAQEDKVLNNVHATFTNTGHFGVSNYQVYASEPHSIKEISAGIFEFKASLLLPSEIGPTSYLLDSIQLNNKYYSSWNKDFEPKTFEVVNERVKKVLTEYQTKYTDDWDEVRSGSNGLKYVLDDGTERVIEEVINEVKMYDIEDVYIPYETIWIENYELGFQHTTTTQYGQDGRKTVYYDSNRNVVYEIIHNQTKDQIIEIGVVNYEDIAPSEERIANSDLDKGQENWLWNGQNGSKKVIYNLKGEVVSEEIIYEATSHIIEVGTAEYHQIPFETVYEDDPWMMEYDFGGVANDYVKEYGTNGTIKRSYDLEGNLLEETILQASKNEIIVRGTLELISIPNDIVYTYYDYEVKSGYNGAKFVYPDGSEVIHVEPENEVRLYEGEKVEIPYEIEYTIYDYRQRQGTPGMKFVKTDGNEFVYNLPNNEIRLYDSQLVEVPYSTVYQETYELMIGEQSIVQEGFNGINRVFYNEYGEEVQSYHTQSPQTEVIYVGKLTEALREERDANPNVSNTIKLIDSETGNVINTINIKGDQFYDRLSEHINRYNQINTSTLQLFMRRSIQEETHQQIINAEYVDIIHRNIEMIVKKTPYLDLTGEEAPLIPDEIPIKFNPFFYDFSRYSQVNVMNEENILVEFEVDLSEIEGKGLAKQENIVRKSLNLLDSNKYYFARAERLESDDFDLIRGTTFNIFVKERLTKELVEANYGVEYTNDLSRVRSGVNGKKYLYSDGSVKLIETPINQVVYTETPLSEIETIDSIYSDKMEYTSGEVAQITIIGKTISPLQYLELRLINEYHENTPIIIEQQLNSSNISYEDGYYFAKLFIRLFNTDKSENFSFQMASLRSENGPGNFYNFANPLNFSFSVADKSLVGIEAEPFDTNYTTDESAVSEGQEGSKLVYSDGTEIILTIPVSAVQLYKSEIAEVDFNTEYTVYAHEVSSGIKGSKLVYENGEEVILEKPTAAIALYDSKVEDFDFVTVNVETSGLAYGETKVMQEGITGRRVVFYDVDGQVVDRLVVSAPVNRILQVGANKQTLVLTPYETTYTTDANKVQSGQNGAKYVYSNGMEEVVSPAVNAVNLYRYVDEEVEFDEITRENSLLAKGQINVVTAGINGLKRAFYDVNGELVESTLLLEAANRIVEVGTYVEVKEEEPEVPEETEPVETDDEENPDLDPEIPGEDEDPVTDPVEPGETNPDETGDEENPDVDPETPGEDENTDIDPVEPGETDNEENSDVDPETPGEDEDPDTHPIDPGETDDEENPDVDPEIPGEDENPDTDPIDPIETDDEENSDLDPETPGEDENPDTDPIDPGETDDEENSDLEPETPGEDENPDTDPIDPIETEQDETIDEGSPDLEPLLPDNKEKNSNTVPVAPDDTVSGETDVEEASKEEPKTPTSAITVDSEATIAAANVLPSTGEKYGTLWLTVAGVSLFAGIGLVFKGKRNKGY